MLLPLCKPLNSAWDVIAGFFAERLFATMLAAMNCPRVSFGFACLAVRYALSIASGVVPSFVATPRGNDSLLLFAFGAAFAAFDGCPAGVCRTRAAGGPDLPCAVTARAAPTVRPVAAATALM